MNNNLYILFKKAVLTGCLFLCFGNLSAQAEWSFNNETKKAYDLALSLQLKESFTLLSDPKTVQQHYVASLAECLELLISEEAEKYAEYEKNFELRSQRKFKKTEVNELFLQAETHLHWAFVYLKFGHEFDAALNFRHAYTVTQDIKSRFPQYKAILKTSALLDVIVGSIPEKYNWVLNVLNIRGKVSLGIDQFEEIIRSQHPLAFEAAMWYAFTRGFVLQKPAEAIEGLTTQLNKKPDNGIALFLAANLHLKNSDSEEALAQLEKLEASPHTVPLYYVDYLKGEIYLHKGAYLNSISSFRSFLNHYKGLNYVKDAHYKIGLCYWLNGNKNDALVQFKTAKNMGKESTEADKYAARSLADTELPNIELTKARYFTDGGYYDEAKRTLEQLSNKIFESKKDEVEYHYRQARLEHKTNNLGAAKAFYIKTIELASNAEWYFAPNSFLQLGYIALKEGDQQRARECFTAALSYKKHPYKNSIDSKARSGLAQLKSG